MFSILEKKFKVDERSLKTIKNYPIINRLNINSIPSNYFDYMMYYKNVSIEVDFLLKNYQIPDFRKCE